MTINQSVCVQYSTAELATLASFAAKSFRLFVRRKPRFFLEAMQCNRMNRISYLLARTYVITLLDSFTQCRAMLSGESLDDLRNVVSFMQRLRNELGGNRLLSLRPEQTLREFWLEDTKWERLLENMDCTLDVLSFEFRFPVFVFHSIETLRFMANRSATALAIRLASQRNAYGVSDSDQNEIVTYGIELLKIVDLLEEDRIRLNRRELVRALGALQFVQTIAYTFEPKNGALSAPQCVLSQLKAVDWRRICFVLREALMQQPVIRPIVIDWDWRKHT